MISLARPFHLFLLAGWWAAVTVGLPAADSSSWQWLVQVLDRPSSEDRSTEAAAAGNSTSRAPSTFAFRANATVDSQGVFLDLLVADSSGTAWPHLRVSDAPAFGQALVFSRSQFLAAVSNLAPELAGHPWAGPERIRITRRARTLAEAEIRQWLAAKLQRESVKDKGELELRFGRPWTPIVVPDEALEIKVTDLPPTGVTGSFILRFELATPREVVGTWQLVAQARIWREVWIARVPLRRGQVLLPEAAALERRDVLTLREAVMADPGAGGTLELTETVPAGGLLYVRSVRPRTIVHRGDVVLAMFQEGAMTISLRVEVLEEGGTGQEIRVRNPSSRREFRGKVQDEQTILVSL